MGVPQHSELWSAAQSLTGQPCNPAESDLETHPHQAQPDLAGPMTFLSWTGLLPYGSFWYTQGGRDRLGREAQTRRPTFWGIQQERRLPCYSLWAQLCCLQAEPPAGLVSRCAFPALGFWITDALHAGGSGTRDFERRSVSLWPGPGGQVPKELSFSPSTLSPTPSEATLRGRRNWFDIFMAQSHTYSLTHPHTAVTLRFWKCHLQIFFNVASMMTSLYTGEGSWGRGSQRGNGMEQTALIFLCLPGTQDNLSAIQEPQCQPWLPPEEAQRQFTLRDWNPRFGDAAQLSWLSALNSVCQTPSRRWTRATWSPLLRGL
jgi:hypothetical protein